MNKTICLNMIVKNESKVILRLLESVLPIIDTFCICDTGSTDNTIEIIENFFKENNITGKILQEKFKNFQYNRNFSLKEARNMADYILLLDADMVLQIDENFNKNTLHFDTYLISQGNQNFKYFNKRLINNNNDIYYIGVTHEYINTPNGISEGKLENIQILDIGDGGSKENKFKRDINLFIEDLKLNPNNDRSHFYLANSYLDIGDFKNALIHYDKHINLSNWNEEIFYNYYKQGFCYKNLKDFSKMIDVWIKAWITRKTRCESLYEIIKYYKEESKYDYCKIYYEIAKNIKFPKNDILFVHKDIYDFKLDLEYSLFAFYVGEKNLYFNFCNLIKYKEIDIENILHNYKFYYLVLDFLDSKLIKNQFIRKINEDYLFRSSTPSIIKHKGQYIMNIRYVNYNIQPNGFYDWVNNIISINKFTLLNENLEIIEEIEPKFNYLNRKYEGVEDIKLLSINDEIIFTGTCYKSIEKIGIARGTYSKENLEYKELFIENENYCEKNWVFLPCGQKMIYKWQPLSIGDLSQNQLIINEKKEMPHIFNAVRGSTNGVLFNKEIWFITHLIHHYENEPRIYYHMFVKFDLNMNLLSYSAPLKFSNHPIEYCCGFIVEDERIIVSHSIWDRESYIKIYDKKYIESLFV